MIRVASAAPDGSSGMYSPYRLQEGICTVGNIANAAARIAFSAAIIGPIGKGGKGIGKVKLGKVNLQQGKLGRVGGGGKLMVRPKVGANIGGNCIAGILKLRHGLLATFPILASYIN